MYILVMREARGPFQKGFFARNSNSIETLPFSNSIFGHQIATHFCTCHVSKEKICWDYFVAIEVTTNKISIEFELRWEKVSEMGPLASRDMILAKFLTEYSVANTFEMDSLRFISYLVIGWCYPSWSGVGVTKLIFSVTLFSQLLRMIKTMINLMI